MQAMLTERNSISSRDGSCVCGARAPLQGSRQPRFPHGGMLLPPEPRRLVGLGTFGRGIFKEPKKGA